MEKFRQPKKLFQKLLIPAVLFSILNPLSTRAIEPESNFENQREIAILLPLSGPFVSLGKTLQEGFELGFKQLTGTTLNHHQYKISFLDSAGDPETVRSFITLLSNKGETAIAAGTPLNTTAWTASQTCEERGLPFLIVGADQDNLINEKSVFSFRLTQTRSAKDMMLSEFIDSKDPAIQSMGIISGENPCAKLQARRLRKFCAKKNLDLALWEVYRSDERNFYDLLNLIKERQPQLLILTINPNLGEKLWQQGQRLELMPPITIATPVNCAPISKQLTSASLPDKQLLYATPWLAPSNPENLPILETHIQAQGFATAEIIIELLNKSLNLTSRELVTALENTNTTTVYGQVNFSGPGLGHQNHLPWHLCSYDEEGTRKVVFPRPQGPEEMTLRTDSEKTNLSHKPQTKKPMQ